METFNVTKVSKCFSDEFYVKRLIKTMNEMLMTVSFLDG